MLRVAVVDDDPKSIERISGFLQTYFEKKGSRYQIEKFERGDKLSFEYRPIYDIIFLDIEMEPISGIETAKIIRRTDSDVIIIFITKMAQFAINGYEVGALGFIVKPVDAESVWFNLEKALLAIGKRDKKDIILPLSGGTKKLKTDSVYYVEARDHDLIYHTDEGEFMLRRKTLGEAAKELGDAFKQYSRCYLINLRHITNISGTALKVAGDELYISRSKRKQVMQDITDYCRSK